MHTVSQGFAMKFAVDQWLKIPVFPLEAEQGFKLKPQRWKAKKNCLHC